MNIAERRFTLAGHRPYQSLRVCAVVLLGALVAAPPSVAARPVADADFLHFDGFHFAKQGRPHAKVHGKAHGKKAKKVQHRASRRTRRHMPAHGFGLGVGSFVHNRASSNWTWLEMIDVPHLGPPQEDEHHVLEDVVELSDDGEIPADLGDDSAQNESDDDEGTEQGLAPELLDLASEFVSDEGDEVFTDVGPEMPISFLSEPFSDALPAPSSARLLDLRPVPEPSALTLAGFAALAAWRIARRDRKARRTV